MHHRTMLAIALGLSGCLAKTADPDATTALQSAARAQQDTRALTSSDLAAARQACADFESRGDAGSSDNPSRVAEYRERIAGAWLLCPGPGFAERAVAFDSVGRWTALADDGSGALVAREASGGSYDFGCYLGDGGAFAAAPAASDDVGSCTLAITSDDGDEQPGGFVLFEAGPRSLLLTGPTYRVYVPIGAD